MSVEKRKPSEFKNKSIPFVVLQSDVIAHIKNSDALAIWVYLCSKPKDWIVRKIDIFQQLGIGRKRYADAIKVLTDIGLLKLVTIRSAKGTVIGTTYDVFNFSDLTEIDRSVSVGKSAEVDRSVCLGEPTEIDRSATLAEVPTSAEVSPFNKDRDILQKKDLLQTQNNKNPNIGTHEQNLELDLQPPKKPKRNTREEKQKFAQSIKELWHVAVVEHGIKKTSRGIGVTDTDINNIQRIIKYAKDDGSAMDYSSLDTWPNYFNELFRICKRKDFLQKCIKGFSWAVKPNTYQKLADDTYLNLEEVA